MVKVLGQTGISLADSYEVEGSIAGVENLDANTVFLTHDMGQVQFAERFAQRVVEQSTSAIAQSTNFAVPMVALPEVPVIRILGIMVTVDTVGRVTRAMVAASQEDLAREIPLWVFHGTATDTIRFLLTAGIGNQNSLRPLPEYTRLPYLLSGPTQREAMPTLNLRGQTSAFGAGNVTITMSVHIAFPQAEGVSSKGIPVPSW